MMNDDLGGG